MKNIEKAIKADEIRKKIIRIALAAAMAVAFMPLLPGIGAEPVHAAQEVTQEFYTTLQLNGPGQETWYTGEIEAKGDHYLSFHTSNRDSYYDITVINSGGQGRLHAYLYDYDNVKKAGKTYIDPGESCTFDYLINKQKLRPDSTYCLNLHADYKGNVDYTVYLTEYPDEAGDTISEARPIGMGETTGALQTPKASWTDHDWVVFQAPENGTYQFTLRNQTSTNGKLHWTRYDENGIKTKDRVTYQSQASERTWTVDMAGGEETFIEAYGFGISQYSISVENISEDSDTGSLIPVDPNPGDDDIEDPGDNIEDPGDNIEGPGNENENWTDPFPEDNPITISVKNKKIRASEVKKKSRTYRLIKVRAAQGTVRFYKTGGSSRLTINERTGQIKVKKGTKRGTYRMKVTVEASGNQYYYWGEISAWVKIKVR